MKFKHIVLAFTSLIAFSACTKEEVTTDDNTTTESLVFTVDNPEEGSMYALNDTVFLQGMIENNVALHGFQLEIINLSADSTVFTYDEHAHDANVTFNQYWVNNVTDHSNMVLVVTAALDHLGTLATDSVHFHCHPM